MTDTKASEGEFIPLLREFLIGKEVKWYRNPYFFFRREGSNFVLNPQPQLIRDSDRETGTPAIFVFVVKLTEGSEKQARSLVAAAPKEVEGRPSIISINGGKLGMLCGKCSNLRKLMIDAKILDNYAEFGMFWESTMPQEKEKMET